MKLSTLFSEEQRWKLAIKAVDGIGTFVSFAFIYGGWMLLTMVGDISPWIAFAVSFLVWGAVHIVLIILNVTQAVRLEAKRPIPVIPVARLHPRVRVVKPAREAPEDSTQQG